MSNHDSPSIGLGGRPSVIPRPSITMSPDRRSPRGYYLANPSHSSLPISNRRRAAIAVTPERRTAPTFSAPRSPLGSRSPVRNYTNPTYSSPTKAVPTSLFCSVQNRYSSSLSVSSTPFLDRLRRKSFNYLDTDFAVPPEDAPRWTLSDLEFLIERWEKTFPGSVTAAENVEITQLILRFRTLDDLSMSLSSEWERRRLYEILRERQEMDMYAELVAASVGLDWEVTKNFSVQSGAGVVDNGILGGIETFIPPSERSLSSAALEIWKDVRGEWRERICRVGGVADGADGEAMDMGVGVGGKYRKPRWWIVELAAGNGWTGRQLDKAMRAYFQAVDGVEF
ncbi:hypothetical protein RUND412_007020 [Rhizina undulata]